MQIGKRILVVEREFLVALDMQRALEGTAPAKMVFARSVDEAAHLANQFSDYDLAIIELTADTGDGIELARDLLEAGVAVVGTSAHARMSETARSLGIPFVGKPWADETLLRACATALDGLPRR